MLGCFRIVMQQPSPTEIAPGPDFGIAPNRKEQAGKDKKKGPNHLQWA
jgi:hypothetical protein